MNLDKVFY